MTKIGATALLLLSVCICAGQTIVNSIQLPPHVRHFRLSFVISNGAAEPQHFVLEVPVLPGHNGVSNLSLTSGAVGQLEGSLQENLLCADVHKSTTGLATKVTLTIDRVPLEHLAGTDEPVHHQLTFERQLDLVLGKPTLITEPIQVRRLNPADKAAIVQPTPPQITVTAAEI